MSMQLEQWPIERCIEYARNPRKNDHAVDKIAAAIKEYGFRVPIVAKSDGLVVDGHLRLKAAKKLGLAQVPVILADDMTDAQIKAFRLSVNRVAEEAKWDLDLLKIELQDLEAEGFDLSLTGFNMDEIGNLLAEPTEGLTDEDAVPEVPAAPVTVEGDVWVLGNHRITCGDSTDALVVELLLGKVKPHLMVTDPPYGVEYDATARRSVQSAGSKPAQGKVQNDDRADWHDAWALFPGDVAYVWHADRTAYEVETSLRSAGFERRSMVIWKKPKFVIGRGHYHPQHECCFYLVRKGATGHWNGDRKQATVWEIDHRKSETGHSTQKPVEAMKRPIENNSSPGQAVYEPFSGSGTTIIAGEMTGRCVYAIELNPAYVDVAIKRWQDFTGQEATLETSGETFNALAAKRIAA